MRQRQAPGTGSGFEFRFGETEAGSVHVGVREGRQRAGGNCLGSDGGGALGGFPG